MARYVVRIFLLLTPIVAGGLIHKQYLLHGGPQNWGIVDDSSRPTSTTRVRIGIQYAANWDLVN